MREVTLAQILEAREQRAAAQRTLLDTYRRPAISFTMNIAGPVKTTPLIERAFRFGLETLRERLPREAVLSCNATIRDTGCEALLAVDIPAEELKTIGTAIEEGSPLGRLFDMDVLDTDGSKLERAAPRACIVCGAPGRACAAGRLHSVSELQRATRSLITKEFVSIDSARIASLAVESLLDEVMTTPKPGLVDRRNNGSHTDMDVNTFKRSAEALKPYFGHGFTLGHQTADKAPEVTFSQLRELGREAERAMYAATGGVNTHKGIVYSFGVLCGALGRLWDGVAPFADRVALLAECAAMTAKAVADDLAAADDSTAGLRCYRAQGLTGIRGEVAAGFPSVTSYGSPAFENALKGGLNANDAGVVALLHLIANVQDTALYHRGGPAGAVFAAEYARSLLRRSPCPDRRDIEAMDEAFIRRNLSPGGCADLLAVTYFLHKLEREKAS